MSTAEQVASARAFIRSGFSAGSIVGKGEVFSILSALAWSVGVVIYKRLGEKLSPIRLNLLKNVLVLGLLGAVLAIWHQGRWPTLGARDFALCLVSGLLGIGIADTLYFKALNLLGAARMGIVGNFYSPFVIVLSFLFLGEHLSGLQLLGFALVSSGVLIIAELKTSAAVARDNVKGVLLGVVSIALMAVAIVMIKRVLEAHDVLLVSAIRVLGGLLGLAAGFAALRGQDRGPLRITRVDAALLLVATVVGQLMSMLFWLAGYKYAQASVASILNESASIFIVLLAWLVLREPLGGRKVVGICCTLAGVACMLVRL